MAALRKEALYEGLTTRSFGRKLFVFSEIDSTNACARTLAEIGNPEGTVVIADYQTAGRGRLGRTWNAEPRSNLLFSVLFRPSARFPAWHTSYLVSEAVAQAVQRSLDIRVATKWPNDLLVDGRKFCGILLETMGPAERTACVAGVGINVNQDNFPADLAGKATSLKLATGKSVDRVSLFQTVMASLESLYEAADRDTGAAMLKSWMDRCTTFGRPVQVSGGGPALDGTAVGLSDDGGLIIRHGDRMTTVYAGDVTISDPAT